MKDGTRSITTNAAEGYVYGAELEAAWRINPQWSLSGYVAWMDARTKAPEVLGGSTIDKPNSRQMPLTDSLALRWTDSSRKYWVEGRILAANDENRITAADQAADYQRIPTNGTPGYVVASLHAGWNMIGYLPPVSDSVWHAVSSISSSFIILQDLSGRANCGVSCGGNFDVLSPGEGYKLLMNAPALFTYPTPLNGVQSAAGQ